MRRSLLALLVIGCGYPQYRYLDDPSLLGDTGDPGDGSTDTDPPGCAKPNGCGGCDDQGVKGARCEPCGQWTCNDTKVICTPASPVPGSACGTCGTSKLECTAVGTTACAVSDDRTVYEDANFKTRDDRVIVLDRTNEVMISFKSVRSMAYVDASIVLKRIPYVCAHVTALPHPDPACTSCDAAAGGGFDCKVPSPSAGFLTMTLYTGTPTALVPLAMASGPATGASDAKKDWVTMPFDKEVSSMPPGTQLSIGITTDSTSFAFEVYGGGAAAFPPAATDTKWWTRTVKPAGAWIEQPSDDIAHVLRGKACAP